MKKVIVLALLTACGAEYDVTSDPKIMEHGLNSRIPDHVHADCPDASFAHRYHPSCNTPMGPKDGPDAGTSD